MSFAEQTNYRKLKTGLTKASETQTLLPAPVGTGAVPTEQPGPGTAGPGLGEM